jgi:hypothetical protein
MLPRHTRLDVEPIEIDAMVLKTQESCFKSIGVGTECRGARLGGDQKSRHVNDEGLAEIYRRPRAH